MSVAWGSAFGGKGIAESVVTTVAQVLVGSGGWVSGGKLSLEQKRAGSSLTCPCFVRGFVSVFTAAC